MANLVTNVVRTEDLRKVQKKTLNFLSDILSKSFGPYGSYTGITKDNMETIYTKDGHTILSNIYFQNQLERAIKNDIEDITRYIVKTVGDGTTSAVILSNIIFNKLVELEETGDSFGTPAETIKIFKKAVEVISDAIRHNGREATLDDIKNIALISTNNNEEIANNIYNIYKEFGMDVFIDVAVSTTKDSQLKIYDGMTIEAGYADTCYITDSKKAISSVRTPNIYIFEDPIDTPNMAAFFDTIIGKNIISPVNQGKYEDIIPTVIMAPTISPDMSSIMRELATWLYGMDDNSKPPLLVVSNIYNREQLSDIAILCGAKTIKKYLDPKLQEADIEKGLAPDINTITEFYGTADEVVSDAYTTKVINPALMKDNEGNYTDTFNTIVTFLEAELEKAKKDGQDASVTGNLKRRINSLKANMVEYLIGGISTGDRDSIRHSVEDAVLNCRSAAANGVGYAANFEAARAIDSILHVKEEQITEQTVLTTISPSLYMMIDIIFDAYKELLNILYSNNLSSVDSSEIVNGCFEEDKPFNIVTGDYDGAVLTSIEADPTILDGIAKIVTIMATSNQFILETPLHNVYTTETDSEADL